MKNTLMIVGSLRQDSFNQTVAQSIATQLKGQDVTVKFAAIDQLPFMNQDIEFPVPATVQAFRDQVHWADNLWIVSPEYNEMIPGVLKNALDWLSRPTTPGTFGAPEFIQKKPVFLTGAGGRKAARPGLQHLQALLTFMGLTPHPDIVGLQIPTKAFMTNNFTLDSNQQGLIDQQVAEALA